MHLSADVLRRLRADLVTAWRSLRGSPGTCVAAVAVIAVGVGANLAVLAVAWGVLLRPLPYADPSRLVVLSVEATDGSDFGVPFGEVAEWRLRLRGVDALAGFARGAATVRSAGAGKGKPRSVDAAIVTRGFFGVLGVPLLRGSTGAADAEIDGWAAVSERSSATVGDLVAARLDGPARELPVTATMPRRFAWPAEVVEAWLPAEAFSRREGFAETSFRLVARRSPGVSVDQLRRDADRVLREVRGDGAGEPGGARATVISLREALVGDVRPVLAALAAGAFLVLLVTCGNVAVLLLGRAADRRCDAALRLALGADRASLVRVVLAEALLLAAAGGLGGLLVATAALESLRSFVADRPDLLPRLADVSFGAPVLAAGVVLVLLAAVACGAGPALRAARGDLSAALRGGTARDPGGRRARSLLVAAQVAVSVVLLAGAALLGQSVLRLLEDDAGVEPDDAWVAELALADGSGRSPAARAAVVREIVRRVVELPGVRSAGVGSALPPDRSTFQIYVRRMTGRGDEGLLLGVVSATPGFLPALGTERLAGAGIAQRHDRPEPEVLLLSRSAARFLAEDGDGVSLVARELPIRLPPFARFSGQPRVLGLVEDVKLAGLASPRGSTLYLPWSARPTKTAYLAVRTEGDAGATLAPGLRRILRRADPDLPVPVLRPLREVMQGSIAERRLRLVPAAGFAGVAFFVALVGISALVSRTISECRRELAIRRALGITAAASVRYLVGRTALLVACGLVVGLAASFLLAGSLRRLLWGIEPTDPATLAAVVVLVAASSLFAAWWPARRAARIEPAELLRSE